MTIPHVPCDLAAERAVLGAILLERDAIIAVSGWLRPEHFYLERHGMVYAAALACAGRREPPDLTTVGSELRRREQIELIGGLSGLSELLSEVPTAVHIEWYARTVERCALGRALIEAGGKIAGLGYDESESIEDRLSAAGQLIYQLATQRQTSGGFVPMGRVASEYLDALQDTPDDDELLGLPTGYPDLDSITQGLKAGELVVLAARPGVGKTALMLSIVYALALQGYRVGIFSLEMDRELLLQRLLAMRLNMETTLIPKLVRRGNHAAINGLAQLAELPIYVDHTAALNVTTIRDRARQLTSEARIDLWVVDYLQLARSDNDRDDDVRRVTAVSNGLTSMAREFRAPVLALSQLSRAVESRSDHVPMLSDLRGSGALEQDASQVWFIYREDLYEPESDKPGVAEIHVSKHRNGGTGVVTLRFEARTTRFIPLESKYQTVDGY
jgi:replicative DNA helicase